MLGAAHTGVRAAAAAAARTPHEVLAIAPFSVNQQQQDNIIPNLIFKPQDYFLLIRIHTGVTHPSHGGGAQGVQRSPTSRTPAGPYGSVFS